MRHEERLLGRGADLPGAHVLHVGLGEKAGLFAHWDHAILASLAVYYEKPAAFKAEVADGEVHELSFADARGIQEL